MRDDEPLEPDGLLEPDDGAPICPACGVTALPAGGDRFECANPDCEAEGDAV